MSKEEETSDVMEKLEEMNQESEKQENNDTKFTINSPIGDVSVDMLEYEAAKKSAKKQVNPPELSLLTQKVQKFLGGQEETDFIYFRPRLGSLIKLHIDDEFDDYEVVKEFTYDIKTDEVEDTKESLESLVAQLENAEEEECESCKI